MAVTTTARLGLTRWSAGTDPLKRTHLDTDASRLEERAGGFLSGTAAARPAAGAAYARFIYWAYDTGEVTFCVDTTGAGAFSWQAIPHGTLAGLTSGDPHTQYALKAGATFTGLLSATAGMHAPITAKAETDAPSTYPTGWSSFTAGTGWPTSAGHVITHKQSGQRIAQWFFASNSNLGDVPLFYRQGYHTDDLTINGWGPWQQIVTNYDQAYGLVATAEGTPSTTFTDLATVGPDATLFVGPRGRAKVTVSAELTADTVGAAPAMSAMVASGPTPLAPGTNRALVYRVPTAGYYVQASRTITIVGLSPGTYTFRAQYRTSAGTATFGQRYIHAEPA